MSTWAETQGHFQWSSLPRGQEVAPQGGMMEEWRQEKTPAPPGLACSHPLT